MLMKKYIITEPVDRVIASGGNGRTFVEEMKRSSILLTTPKEAL